MREALSQAMNEKRLRNLTRAEGLRSLEQTDPECRTRSQMADSSIDVMAY